MGLSSPDCGMVVEENVIVPIRDGSGLATDIYWPSADGEPHPGPLPAQGPDVAASDQQSAQGRCVSMCSSSSAGSAAGTTSRTWSARNSMQKITKLKPYEFLHFDLQTERGTVATRDLGDLPQQPDIDVDPESATVVETS